MTEEKTTSNDQKNNKSGDKRRKLAGLVIIIVVTLATLTYVINWWHFNQNYAQTDNAQIDGHIAYISSKVGGKVSKVFVDDFQTVKKGEILVEIDPEDYEIDYEKALANLEVLQNNLKVIEQEVISADINASTAVNLSSSEASSSNVKIKETEENQKVLLANLASDKASMEEAKKNLDRYSYLTKRKSTTQLEYDKMKATYDVAKADYDATLAKVNQNKETIAVARSNYNTARAGVKKAKALYTNVNINEKRKEVIQAQVKQAKVAVEEAKLKLSYTKIYAPVDGYIGRKSVETGQVIQPSQPLMVVVPDQDIWITANYKETKLEKIKVGQPVKVKVDAYPSHKFTGRVESLSPATGARFALIPPDNASGNFTKVVQKVPIKIVFDKIKDKDIHLVPGMNVITAIKISGK